MEEGPTPVVFPAAPAASTSVLDEEREAHRRRAERFGTDYVQPEKRSDLRQQFRRERLKKDGFKTGLDLFDEEEVARMRQRAARFQTDFRAPEYGPAEAPEDEQKKAQRAARFGTQYAPPGALMDIDVLEERQERPADIPRRPEAIHLYGVDCMTSAECLAYFGDWGPTFVEWLDDSSCNVLFEDEHTAKRALVGRGRPLPPGSADGPDTAGLDPSDIASAPFLWHKGGDFVKAGTPIPLMYRMATAADVKPARGRKLSRHLWKLPPKQAVRQQKEEVRRKQNGAANGQDGQNGHGAAADGEDVHMRRRGQRSARKRRRGAGDVEMADAEEMLEDVEEEAEGGSAEPKRPAVADLRELLGRQPEQRAGLFSASAAGFVPALQQEQQADEPAGGAGAMGSDAGGDGPVDEVPGDAADGGLA